MSIEILYSKIKELDEISSLMYYKEHIPFDFVCEMERNGSLSKWFIESLNNHFIENLMIEPSVPVNPKIYNATIYNVRAVIIYINVVGDNFLIEVGLNKGDNFETYVEPIDKDIPNELSESLLKKITYGSKMEWVNKFNGKTKQKIIGNINLALLRHLTCGDKSFMFSVLLKEKLNYDEYSIDDLIEVADFLLYPQPPFTLKSSRKNHDSREPNGYKKGIIEDYIKDRMFTVSSLLARNSRKDEGKIDVYNNVGERVCSVDICLIKMYPYFDNILSGRYSEVEKLTVDSDNNIAINILVDYIYGVFTLRVNTIENLSEAHRLAEMYTIDNLVEMIELCSEIERL